MPPINGRKETCAFIGGFFAYFFEKEVGGFARKYLYGRASLLNIVLRC